MLLHFIYRECFPRYILPKKYAIDSTSPLNSRSKCHFLTYAVHDFNFRIIWEKRVFTKQLEQEALNVLVYCHHMEPDFSTY